MPVSIDEIRINSIEFVTESINNQQVERAKVKISIKGQTVEESVITIVVPWNRDFRDLSILIDSEIRAIGEDLSDPKGLPPQLP